MFYGPNPFIVPYAMLSKCTSECVIHRQRQCGLEPAHAPARPARAHHRFRSVSTLFGICHVAGTSLLGPIFWQIGNGFLGPNPDLSAFALAHPDQQCPYDPALCFTDADVEAVISELAQFILASRQARLPTPHKHAKAMHWNLTSLHKLDTCQAQRKLRILSGHLSKGPVFLTETKWDSTTAMRASLNLAGHRVLDSPAVIKPPRATDRPAPTPDPTGQAERS